MRNRLRWAAGAAVAIVVTGAATAAVAVAVALPDAAKPSATPASVFPLAADYCYAQMMMPHHEQAVLMSEILLAKEGISERSIRFAEFVRSDQSREVAATRDWAEVWREELRTSPPAVAAAADTGHGHGSTTLAPDPAATAADSDAVDVLVDCGDAADPDRFAAMPGMLSAQQLDELRAASGLAAEILYLELMIPHHEGALDMSRAAIVEGNNVYISQMARHILVEQDREITAMRTMIAELPQ